MLTNPRPVGARLRRHYPSQYSDCLVGARGPGPQRWRDRLRDAVLQAYYGYGRTPVSRSRRLLLAGAYLWMRLVARYDRYLCWRGQGRVLDVGCGRGAYLAELRRHGWQVTGLEPSPTYSQVARDQFGLTVHTATVPGWCAHGERFDLITLWHVLEHVDDPFATVSDLRGLLAPGGLLVAEVPNIAGWAARRFGPDWYHLDLPRHLHHFTPTTLQRVFRRVGFRSMRLTYSRRASGHKMSHKRHGAQGHRLSLMLARRKRVWRLAGWIESLLGHADVIRITARR